MVASLAFVYGRCSRWRAVSRIVQRSSSASEPHDRSKSCCPRADTRMVAQKRPTYVTKSVTKSQSPCLGAERPRPMEDQLTGTTCWDSDWHEILELNRSDDRDSSATAAIRRACKFLPAPLRSAHRPLPGPPTGYGSTAPRR